MLTKKELYQTTEHWVDELQNEIYRQVHAYMQKYMLNQSELASKWGVSKGFVSQILNGNCNFSLKKLVELSLKLEKAPVLQYIPLQNFDEHESLSRLVEEQMKKPFCLPLTRERTKVNLTATDFPVSLNLLSLSCFNLSEDFYAA